MGHQKWFSVAFKTKIISPVSTLKSTHGSDVCGQLQVSKKKKKMSSQVWFPHPLQLALFGPWTRSVAGPLEEQSSVRRHQQSRESEISALQRGKRGMWWLSQMSPFSAVESRTKWLFRSQLYICSSCWHRLVENRWGNGESTHLLGCLLLRWHSAELALM